MRCIALQIDADNLQRAPLYSHLWDGMFKLTLMKAFCHLIHVLIYGMIFSIRLKYCHTSTSIIIQLLILLFFQTIDIWKHDTEDYILTFKCRDLECNACYLCILICCRWRPSVTSSQIFIKKGGCMDFGWWLHYYNHCWPTHLFNESYHNQSPDTSSYLKLSLDASWRQYFQLTCFLRAM